MTTTKVEPEYPEEPRYVDISQSDEEDDHPWQREETTENITEDAVDDTADEDEGEADGDKNATPVKDDRSFSFAHPVEKSRSFTRPAAPQPRFPRRPAAAARKPHGNSRPVTTRATSDFSAGFPHTQASRPSPAVRSDSLPEHEPPQKMLPAKVDQAGVSQPEEVAAIESTVPANEAARAGGAAQTAKTLLPEWYILEDIIQKYQPLPEGSIILGIDQQGKPLVVSLDDVSFGALLFMGDSTTANRKHLQSVMASAEMLNQPEILQIDVITPTPDAYGSKRSNLRRICQVEEDCIYSLLGDYLTLVEQRLRDERQLPYQLLVLDQIETLTDRLAEESLRFLRWIIRRGPQVGIWPLASIDSESLAAFDLKTYKSFGFQLFGKMTRAATVTRFTRMSPQRLQTLSPGNQGCFMIEEDVVSYSVPEVAR